MVALHDSMSMMGDRSINVEVRLNPTITLETFRQEFNPTPINQEEGCKEEPRKMLKVRNKTHLRGQMFSWQIV